MSRLDYVTIAIVAICIFAIVFLVVKTSKLMNREEAATESNRVEDALANQESSVEDLYGDLEIDTSTYDSYENSRSSAAAGDDQEDNEVDPFDPVEDEGYGDERTVTPPPSTKRERATTSTASREKEELTARGAKTAPSAPAARQPAARQPATSGQASPDRTTKPAAGASTAGGFLVIAGSFRYKANAEEMVRKLKSLGYEGAEVGSTNAGAYAVAVVGRLNDLQSARNLVSELESKHKIDARVQRQ